MKFFKIFLFFIFLVLAVYGFIAGYPYLFAKMVEGKIEKVERVNLDISLLQSGGTVKNMIPPQVYSFAIAIKTTDGRVWTASSEDRQWAAAKEGYCVKAKYFPYPPWNLDKSGTYYGARLLEAWECP